MDSFGGIKWEAVQKGCAGWPRRHELEGCPKERRWYAFIGMSWEAV